MPPAPLPSLEERFALGPPLGAGGFGVVHAGSRRRDGASVAIKLPQGDLDESDTARIRREAQLLQGLEHPALADFHGAFQDAGGRLALVYQRVDGEDLSLRLRVGAPATDQVLRWVEDLAGALATLHAAGLVHRDLKPENVKVTPAGRAVLLDYGLLRPFEGQTVTATGAVLGTPEFMAPEQIRGERLGPATDVYALGCLVFEVLDGRPPFSGPLNEVLAGHLRGAVPAPRLASPTLARAAHRALEELLAKDPAARPPIEEVPELLGRALREGGLPPGAAPTAAVMPRHTPRRREPARTPRRSTARPRRPRVLAAGLFGGVALASFLARGEDPGAPPDHAPAPSAAATATTKWSVLEELLESLEAELERARGAYLTADGDLLGPDDSLEAPGVTPLLEVDPARFRFVARHMPTLRRCYQWLAEAPMLAHELAPELRGRLQEYEDRFATTGLPRPFYPAMELAPAADPWPVDEAVTGWIRRVGALPPDHPVPAALRGWSAVALREAWDLQQHFLELEGEVMRSLARNRAPAGLEHVPGFYLVLRSHARLERFVRENGDTPAQRRAFLDWHRDRQRQFLRVLLAAGRATEAAEPASDMVMLLIQERLRDWTAYHPAAFRPGPPELLVGGRVTRRPTRLLLAGVMENLDGICVDWHMDRGPYLEAQGRLLARPPARPPDEGTGILWASPLAAHVRQLADHYANIEDRARLRALYRLWSPHLLRLPLGIRETLIKRTGWVHLRGEEPLLTPEEASTLHRQVCELGEEFLRTYGEPSAQLSKLCRNLPGTGA